MPFSNLNLITVTGKYLLLNGTPAKGVVTFVPSTVLLDMVANEIVYPVEIDATLSNTTGTFSIQLPATDDTDLSPIHWTYTVTEKITGSARSRSFTMEVPVNSPGGTIDMADVTPVDASVPSLTYVLVSTYNAHVGNASLHTPFDEIVRQSLLYGSVSA